MGELSVCQGQAKAYHSKYGCSSFLDDTNFGNTTQSWLDDLTIDHGYDSDPVWGKDNFRVLEHKTDQVMIYLRDSDSAI